MFGKFIATALSRWQITVGIIVLLLGSHTLAYYVGHGDGEDSTTAAIAKAEIKQQRKTRQADENADAARQTDDERNDANAQEREAAITRDGRTGLSCQRLRAAGYREADLPEPCRYGSGDGSEAGPAN